MVVNQTRIRIEEGQIIFKTRNPLWYWKYNPEISARGRVCWVNSDAAMVCVKWTTVDGQSVYPRTENSMLGSYDIDRWDTHYGVMVNRSSDHIHPAWLTDLGLEYWSNSLFRYMH